VIAPRVLVALLAWGVFAFGAVYPWGYWPLAAGAGVLGIWGIADGRAWADPRIRMLAAALSMVVLAIGCQLVAWPYGLSTILAPGLDSFLRQSQVGFIPGPAHALSIAPANTAVVFVRVLAFSFLLVGLTRVLKRWPLEWLINQLMGLGVALVMLALVQKALTDPRDTTLVYGIWKPLYGGNPFGPFINRNHFAGWMVMVLPVVLAYSCALVQRSEESPGQSIREWFRWLLTVHAHRFLLVAVVVLVMGMALVLTNSRSGVAAFGVSLTVLAYAVLRRAASKRMKVAGAIYLGLLLGGALIWAGLSPTLAAFLKAPGDVTGRSDAWADAVRILHDFPWAGTGLGTFGRAMLVYQSSRRETMYLQAHNDYLQLAVEGGVLVCLPILIAFIVIVRGIRRRFRGGDDDIVTYWLRVGAVAGLAGIAAQSLVEFSLQMPGNALMLVLLLAIASHRPSRRAPHAYRV
jgi:hypothetical protein